MSAGSSPLALLKSLNQAWTECQTPGVEMGGAPSVARSPTLLAAAQHGRRLGKHTCWGSVSGPGDVTWDPAGPFFAGTARLF